MRYRWLLLLVPMFLLLCGGVAAAFQDDDVLQWFAIDALSTQAMGFETRVSALETRYITTIEPTIETFITATPTLPFPVTVPVPSPSPTLTPTPCYAQATVTVNLNLRATPSIYGQRLVTIPQGQQIALLPGSPVTANGYTWRQVQWQGNGGWVATQFITLNFSSC